MALDTRIPLHKLEVFSAVVELGGVSKAAEHLRVSQPVVTAHIRSLEERIGTDLFSHQGRQLELTEAGRAVYAWTTEVLTRTRELSRHLEGLSDGKRGAVVVGASMSTGSYILPAVLSRFRKQRPLVEVRLQVSESDNVLRATEVGECDFAVIILDNELESSSLETELLREEQLVVVASSDADLPEGAITVDELAQLPFVESATGMIRRSLVESQLNTLGIHNRNVVIELGHPEAMKRATQQGLGVTMLFRSAVQDDIEHGRLREVEVKGVTLTVPVYLIYRKAKLLSTAQTELMKAIRDEVSRG